MPAVLQHFRRTANIKQFDSEPHELRDLLPQRSLRNDAREIKLFTKMKAKCFLFLETDGLMVIVIKNTPNKIWFWTCGV